MGSLRRTVSSPSTGLVSDFYSDALVRKSHSEPNPRVLEFPSKPTDDVAVPPGIANLWVTPATLDCTEPGCGGLPDLRRALTNCDGIAVAYDFRGCMPDKEFTRGLSTFCKEHLELWMNRLKSFAVVIQENVLDAAAQGPVASFLRDCPCPPGCPFVVCHCTDMVDSFFQACLKPQAGSRDFAAQFLSVVDVLDDPRSPPGRKSRPWGRSRSCLASLAPPPSSAEASRQQARMLHTLPNGDTQVIQSPPQDVVVRTDPWLASQGQWSVEEEGVKPLAPVAEDESGDLNIMAALAFECPKEKLQQLVGAHFHVGELYVDAETGSALRTSWRCNQAGHDPTAGLLGACFAGAFSCLCEIIQGAVLGSMTSLVEPKSPKRLAPKLGSYCVSSGSW